MTTFFQKIRAVRRTPRTFGQYGVFIKITVNYHISTRPVRIHPHTDSFKLVQCQCRIAFDEHRESFGRHNLPMVLWYPPPLPSPPELLDQHLPARAPTCNARFWIWLPVILSPFLIRPPAYLMLLLDAYGFVFWDFAICACIPSMLCAFKFCQISRQISGPIVVYHV